MCSILQSVISMDGQLELLRQYKAKLETAMGSERTSAIVADSLYVVAAGSDDIANTYFHTNLRRQDYTISNYTDFLATSAAFFFEVLFLLPLVFIKTTRFMSFGTLKISTQLFTL